MLGTSFELARLRNVVQSRVALLTTARRASREVGILFATQAWASTQSCETCASAIPPQVFHTDSYDTCTHSGVILEYCNVWEFKFTIHRLMFYWYLYRFSCKVPMKIYLLATRYKVHARPLPHHDTSNATPRVTCNTCHVRCGSQGHSRSHEDARSAMPDCVFVSHADCGTSNDTTSW